MQHICRRAGDRLTYYAWFAAMHTRIDLLFVADRSEEELTAVAEAAQRLIADIECAGNCFDNNSELSRLNGCEPGQQMKVSDCLYDLLSTCRNYSLRTGGLFDVTVESAGHDADTFSSITLADDNMVSLTRAGVYINMSGMLKGYALDALRQMLLSEGVGDAFLSLGNSSVMGMGCMSGTDGWPMTEIVGGMKHEILLRDECLTTSGNVDGVNHHIVNPLTNREIAMNRKVSVVTHSATEGEVLSTSYLLADDAQCTHLDATFRPRRVVIDGKMHINSYP